MDYRRFTTKVVSVAGVGLCVALLIMVSSCEQGVDPLKPPTGSQTQSMPSNDAVKARVVEKGAPAPRAPMVVVCPEGSVCGPMDVAILIDNTGSMFGAIDNVKAELDAILDCIDVVSGGDYRLALMTFADDLTILDNFSAVNKAAVGANILAITAGGGAGGPEASDEAVNTAVNALAAGGRPQNIDFTPDWRGAGVTKILILVTDAPPGGFDDTYTVGVDDVNAHTRALEALAKGIKISAIFVPTGGDYSGQAAIMQDYATTSGGVYFETADDGSGTATAIIDIISTCGSAELNVPMDIKPGSCPNPLNTKDRGVLPVALLGFAGFDVGLIDVTTLALEGVTPLRSAYEDVGAPYPGELVDCLSCWKAGRDGYGDLTLKFSAQAIVAALGAVADQDCRTLTLTGSLLDGTPIVGKDIVRILVKPTTQAEGLAPAN